MSAIHVYWGCKAFEPCLTHHCRLEHVSTAQYTLLTRSDIIRMSQPVWMSLSLSFLSPSLSSCLFSVSIYSPLLCYTSPQLPVFCSFGLFSLRLSLPLPSLSPHPSCQPSFHLQQTVVVYLCEWSSLGRAVTTPHTGGEVFYWETRCIEKNNCSAPPSSLLPLLLFTPCLSGICSLLCCILPSYNSLTRSPWR